MRYSFVKLNFGFRGWFRTNIMRALTTIVFTTLFSLWSGTYLRLQLYLVRWNPLVLYTFMIFINLARYCHQRYLLRFHRIRIHSNIHFCISVQFYLKSHVLPLDDPEIRRLEEESNLTQLRITVLKIFLYFPSS